MMGTDRAFARAQRANDNAEPPPDTRKCDSCGRQQDLGREVTHGVRTEWWCDPCLDNDGRCLKCGRELDAGGCCSWCEPAEEAES